MPDLEVRKQKILISLKCATVIWEHLLAERSPTSTTKPKIIETTSPTTSAIYCLGQQLVAFTGNSNAQKGRVGR